MWTFQNKCNCAKNKGQWGTCSYLSHFCQMLLVSSRWLAQFSPVESQPSNLHPFSMLYDRAPMILWSRETYFINSLSAEELFLRPLINNVEHQWSWKTLTSALYFAEQNRCWHVCCCFWLKTDVCEVRWKRQECMDILEPAENTHHFLILMWGLNLYSGKSFKL